MKQKTRRTLDVVGFEAVCDAGHGLVRREKHKGNGVARSHGVSVYFPRGEVTVAYDRLAFARDTRWDEFLKKL